MSMGTCTDIPLTSFLAMHVCMHTCLDYQNAFSGVCSVLTHSGVALLLCSDFSPTYSIFTVTDPTSSNWSELPQVAEDMAEELEEETDLVLDVLADVCEVLCWFL